MEREWLSDRLDEKLSLAEIALLVGRDPSTVGYWVRKHGLQAAHVDRHRARGGLSREVLEPLVDDGLAIEAIAVRLDRSAQTVKHWLKHHGLETVRARRLRENRARDPDDQREVVRVCAHHGESVFALESRGYFRCKRCRVEAVVRWRRNVKDVLVAEAGGACALCGYDRCPRALEFHHLDPATKDFHLASGGIARSVARLRAEVSKCILLCANCHAEVEAGVSQVA